MPYLQGKRIAVSMPPGHLLVQAGKQLEYVSRQCLKGVADVRICRHLTGGLALAGFHEVVATDATLAALYKAKELRPDRPRIRISSTFFYHLSPQELIAPLPELEERRKQVMGDVDVHRKYEKMYVGELVQRCDISTISGSLHQADTRRSCRELQAISLMA